VTLPLLEVLGPFRTAILANPTVTEQLATWNGSKAVFTKRPVPDDAKFPLIVVGPMVERNGLADGINDHRPIVTLDVTAYGAQPEHYRAVDLIAEHLFSMFHQQRNVVVDGYATNQILASGPFPAPGDDESSMARRVRFNLRLRAHFQ
jgi:hypothetical protein